MSDRRDADAAGSPSGRLRAGRLRMTLAGGLLIAALVHPAAVLLGRWDWRFDLLSHFPMLGFTVTLAALLVAVGLPARFRIVAPGLVLLAAWQVAPLVRHAGANPVAPQPGSPERLRLLLANVLYANEDHDALAALIRAERPDVVGLIEVNEDWLGGLERAGVRALYPYRRELPLGPRGLALWFRERPESLGFPEQVTPDGNPLLTATFRFAGRTRRLWLVHPPNPLFEPGRSTPDLAVLGTRIGQAGGSQIVLGDLNRGDGSPWFAAFLRATGLRDSRYGFGRQPTFPSGFPLRIAIDHVLVSTDLAVVRRRLGPGIGSDHLPVIVDLAPAAVSASTSPAIAATSLSAHFFQPSASTTASALPNCARSASRRNRTRSAASFEPS